MKAAAIFASCFLMQLKEINHDHGASPTMIDARAIKCSTKAHRLPWMGRYSL